jgi:coenzyme F420-reducing hydrogenase alpha subunit
MSRTHRAKGGTRRRTPLGVGTHTVKVDALARVEGEGALHVRIKDGTVAELSFRIFEPPRFFEALLKGRIFSDAPDITSRICGICPVAYLMGASQAMEDALGVEVGGPLRDLRRLIYCGEWIESHVLHAAMLHAPDFLGLDDALLIADKNPELVNTALRLKKLGNRILEVVGGRAVHPVNLRVGGFYRAPDKAEVRALVEPLRWGVEAAVGMTKTFAGFDFPDFEQDYTMVSLRHPEEYAIHEGRIISSRGLDIAGSAFLDHFTEEHVKHSNALQSVGPDGLPYLVGPLARYSNNYRQCTEAPRGICYHRYQLDDGGRILDACIIPPTSQNQRQIEADLKSVVERNLTLSDEELTWRCEQTIRNYDPCISCATHFLNLTIQRD